MQHYKNAILQMQHYKNAILQMQLYKNAILQMQHYKNAILQMQLYKCNFTYATLQKAHTHDVEYDHNVNVRVAWVQGMGIYRWTNSKDLGV